MVTSSIKHIIIVDKANGSINSSPDRLIITATDFIANDAPIDLRKAHHIKVINLCSNYDYLSKGYYCSLLAEARNMRCVPSVANIVTLNWKRHYQSSLPELNGLLERHFNEPADEPLSRTYTVYFGRIENPKLEAVARRLFDLFRFPLMTLEIKYGTTGRWLIEAVEPLPLSDIPREKLPVFSESLDKFTGAAWRAVANKPEKYWIAILQDPEEKLPPSDKVALNKFAKVGKDMGLFIEFITRQDYATLLEYDALFIRETTAINHHTFRFAHKAESEGIPCIDDTQSIIRCCNKVFLHEMLHAHKVPLPATRILDKRSDRNAESDFEYPMVLKIPDGSFSRGMAKVTNAEEFRKASAELFRNSEIILAQAFVKSEYDWRVGVLGGEAIYACKYYMAKDHWQIYNHDAKKPGAQSGNHETMPVSKVPKDVLAVACKAAKLVGNGLYGVDLKQTENGIYVMEVNDNPSIEHGVEDQHLGDDLYRMILGHLVKMIESR
jgi:glutathione synthase/RimK-type ligase-like ATP-grasp enzyme